MKHLVLSTLIAFTCLANADKAEWTLEKEEIAVLGEDELFETIPAEGPLAKEHGSVEIGLQGYAPGFKFTGCVPMPVFEIGRIERKAERRAGTGTLIPSIGQDHATQIPK